MPSWFRSSSRESRQSSSSTQQELPCLSDPSPFTVDIRGTSLRPSKSGWLRGNKNKKVARRLSNDLYYHDLSGEVQTRPMMFDGALKYEGEEDPTVIPRCRFTLTPDQLKRQFERIEGSINLDAKVDARAGVITERFNDNVSWDRHKDKFKWARGYKDPSHEPWVSFEEMYTSMANALSNGEAEGNTCSFISSFLANNKFPNPLDVWVTGVVPSSLCNVIKPTNSTPPSRAGESKVPSLILPDKTEHSHGPVSKSNSEVGSQGLLSPPPKSPARKVSNDRLSTHSGTSSKNLDLGSSSAGDSGSKTGSEPACSEGRSDDNTQSGVSIVISPSEEVPETKPHSRIAPSGGEEHSKPTSDGPPTAT